MRNIYGTVRLCSCIRVHTFFILIALSGELSAEPHHPFFHAKCVCKSPSTSRVLILRSRFKRSSSIPKAFPSAACWRISFLRSRNVSRGSTSHALSCDVITSHQSLFASSSIVTDFSYYSRSRCSCWSSMRRSVVLMAARQEMSPLNIADRIAVPTGIPTDWIIDIRSYSPRGVFKIGF